MQSRSSQDHADMNAPPLIRSTRRLLQEQLQRAAARPTRNPWAVARIHSNSSRAASTARLSSHIDPSASRNDDSGNSAGASETRLPRQVQALYLQPLRRECEYGVPTADLQLRSYSVRGLEFYCDFALRAAYYLGLPAFGPVPLPRITERWTVPKSNFIFKKSQENFERITVRRLIQVRDGHPDAVQVWLAFLRKHAYPGIGMKANVWEFSKLGVGKMMDEAVKDVAKIVEPRWEHLAESKTPGTVEEVEELLTRERVKAAGGR